MTSKTHNAIGFASLLTAASYCPQSNLNTATIIGALIANIIGTLLPDLDQEGNRLWDLLPGGNLVGKIFKGFLLGHRTISHSFLGIFLIYRLTFWLLPLLFNPQFINIEVIAWALIIGYVSHLAADGLTEEGLPLFFPLKVKLGFPPIKSWRIKTGKWFEKFIVFPAVVVFILAFILYNWKVVVNIFIA